jgi:hypothetical protein
VSAHLVPPSPVPQAALSIAELRDDVIAALIDEGYKRPDATHAVWAQTSLTFSDLFRDSLNWLRTPKTGSVPAVKTGKQKPEPSAEPRLCQRDCGRRLRSHNQSGVCTTCQRAEIRQGMVLAGAPQTTQPAPQTKPVLQNAANGRFHVLLSERQVNRFLASLELDWRAFVALLPAELKIALVNHYFLHDLDEAVSERGTA